MLYDNLNISLKAALNVSIIEEFEMKIDKLEFYNENAKKMEQILNRLHNVINLINDILEKITLEHKTMI